MEQPSNPDGRSQAESTNESARLPLELTSSHEPSNLEVERVAAHAEVEQASTSSARRPSFVFFGSLAALVLGLDVSSKAWAEIELGKRPPADPALVLIDRHLSLTLAYNKGGAWGLLQDSNELIRKPFFFGVSVAAILFIVSLYTRLLPEQRALKWGLPLVLGGALGNLADRIIRGSVVDFIDYRAGWVVEMNRLIAKLAPGWNITDHWPTFNAADVSICVGVGLMALDMITARRGPERDAGADTTSGGTGSGEGGILRAESRTSQS